MCGDKAFVFCNRCIVIDLENLRIVDKKDIPSNLESEVENYIFNWQESGYYVIYPEMYLRINELSKEYQTKECLEHCLMFES